MHVPLHLSPIPSFHDMNDHKNGKHIALGWNNGGKQVKLVYGPSVQRPIRLARYLFYGCGYYNWKSGT